MAKLIGMDEYLQAEYEKSIFDQAHQEASDYVLWMHGRQKISGSVVENLKFDIRFKTQNEELVIPKIEIKILHLAKLDDATDHLIQSDDGVVKQFLKPLLMPSSRYFVKNKTLFVAMKEREVVAITLLEGETLKGLITGFSKYELTISMKGGVPVTVLRHAVLRAKNKKGRNLLKTFQDIHKDWKSSEFFVE